MRIKFRGFLRISEKQKLTSFTCELELIIRVWNFDANFNRGAIFGCPGKDSKFLRILNIKYES